MRWRNIPKIDAHVHFLPDEVLRANPYNCDEFSLFGRQEDYIYLMERYNLSGAVIMPFNDPWMMSNDCDVQSVNQNLLKMKERFAGKFFAFADISTSESVENSVSILRKAIADIGLDGLKIHPENTNMNADDEYNKKLLIVAAELGVPVTIHSYPKKEDDACSASRVANLVQSCPNANVIVAHMGAFQWESLLETEVYVDMSAILPDYIRKLGVKETNRILRAFGAERLIFATDYPTNKVLRPESIYETYCDLLDLMDFNESESEMIAMGNIMKLLKRG